MNLINILDEQIYNYIIKLMSTNMTITMTIISHIGSAIGIIGITISLIILLKDKQDAKFITLNLILVFIANRILKFFIARPRPPEVLRIVNESRIWFSKWTCNDWNCFLWIFNIFNL